MPHGRKVLTLPSPAKHLRSAIVTFLVIVPPERVCMLHCIGSVTTPLPPPAPKPMLLHHAAGRWSRDFLCTTALYTPELFLELAYRTSSTKEVIFDRTLRTRALPYSGGPPAPPEPPCARTPPGPRCRARRCWLHFPAPPVTTGAAPPGPALLPASPPRPWTRAPP